MESLLEGLLGTSQHNEVKVPESERARQTEESKGEYLLVDEALSRPGRCDFGRFKMHLTASVEIEILHPVVCEKNQVEAATSGTKRGPGEIFSGVAHLFASFYVKG